MSYIIEAILTLFYTALFIFLIYKINFFSIDNISRKLLSGIFLFKIICGIILVLIYTYYYKDRANSDIFKFYDDARNVIYKILFTNPVDYFRIVTGINSEAKDLDVYYNQMFTWYKGFNYNLPNDNRIVIRLSAILMIFSFGYYYVHIIFMTFISFIGLTALYKLFYNIFSSKKYELIFAVYLAPSVLLWTSGVLKESIIMFALGFLLYTFDKIFIKKMFKTGYIFLFLISIFILLISKFYILLIAIPGLISLVWINKTKNKLIFLKFLIVHLIFLLMAFNSSIFVKSYDFTSILSRKQHDFVNFIDSLPNVGSKINIPELNSTWISVIKNSPIAFANTLLRPAIYDANSLLVLLSSLENLLIAILIILCVFFRNSFAKINNSYFYLALFFTIFVFTLSGITTPVFGALVRYKTPALPFLFIVFLFLIDTEKLYKFLNRKKFLSIK